MALATFSRDFSLLLLVFGLPTTVAAADRISPASTSENIEAVVEDLKTIRNGYRKGIEGLGNIQVTGRILPGGEQFTFTAKDGKRRYDQEYWPEPNQQSILVRLDDGDRLFKLDGRSLETSSLARRNEKWRTITSQFSVYEAPLFQKRHLAVDERCDWFIELVTGTGQFAGSRLHRDRLRELTIRPDGGLWLIEDIDGPARPAADSTGIRVRIWVDPALHFKMVRFIEEKGSNPENWIYRRTIENQFRESAAGRVFLSSGRMRIEESGQVVLQRGNDASGECGIEVIDVRIGEFPVPDGYFSRHSLPVRN